MLAVRRSLTEILLEVTDQEIETVSQEELARYTATQGICSHPKLYGDRTVSEPLSSARNVRLLTVKLWLTMIQEDQKSAVNNFNWPITKFYFRFSMPVHWIHVVSVINVGFIYMVKASRINAMKAGKSKALAAIASGLGEFTSYSRSRRNISHTENTIIYTTPS